MTTPLEDIRALLAEGKKIEDRNENRGYNSLGLLPRYCEALERAVEELNYYASEKNWHPVHNDPRKPTARMVIGSLDTEGNDWIGGRQARIGLADIARILKGEKT